LSVTTIQTSFQLQSSTFIGRTKLLPTSVSQPTETKVSRYTPILSATSSFNTKIITSTSSITVISGVSKGNLGLNNMNRILITVTAASFFIVLLMAIWICCQRRSIRKKLRRHEEAIQELKTIGLHNMHIEQRERTFTELSIDGLQADTINNRNKELINDQDGVHSGFQNPMMCRRSIDETNKPRNDDLAQNENQNIQNANSKSKRPSIGPVSPRNSFDISKRPSLGSSSQQSVNAAKVSKRPFIGPEPLSNLNVDKQYPLGRQSIFEFPPVPSKKMLKLKKSSKPSKNNELPPPPPVSPVYHVSSENRQALNDSVKENNSPEKIRSTTLPPMMPLLDEYRLKLRSKNNDRNNIKNKELNNDEYVSMSVINNQKDDGYDSWNNDLSKNNFSSINPAFVAPHYD